VQVAANRAAFAATESNWDFGMESINRKGGSHLVYAAEPVDLLNLLLPCWRGQRSGQGIKNIDPLVAA
jgi:hypothetical protein